MNLDTFGRTLRTRRQELGRTLADVGDAAGCTRQNVHKVERALSNPTVQTLNRIASAVNMRLELRLIDNSVPDRDARDPEIETRDDLETRMTRLCRRIPAERLEELEARLNELEARLLPQDELQEQQRTEALAGLLQQAGIEPALALQVAREERDKPEDWTDHPDRFTAVFDRARTRMAS